MIFPCFSQSIYSNRFTINIIACCSIFLWSNLKRPNNWPNRPNTFPSNYNYLYKESSATVPMKVLRSVQTNQKLMPKNERGVKCQSTVFKIVGKPLLIINTYTFAFDLHAIHGQGYSECLQDKNGSRTCNVGYSWKWCSFCLSA